MVKEERYHVGVFKGLGRVVVDPARYISGNCFLCHSFPFTACCFPLWYLLSQVHLLVHLVFSGIAAGGAPLGANIREFLLLAPFLCPRGGVQPVVGALR